MVPHDLEFNAGHHVDQPGGGRCHARAMRGLQALGLPPIGRFGPSVGFGEGIVRMLFPDASKRNAAWVDKYAQIWDKAPNANRARAEILRDTIGDPEWARSSDPEGDQGGEATSGEEVQGEDVRQRDLRPTLRHGSTAGDDGSGVTFSLEENKAAAYELSGVPVSEKQALDAQFERIRAVEGEDFAGARLGVALVGEACEDACGLVKKGKGDAI